MTKKKTPLLYSPCPALRHPQPTYITTTHPAGSIRSAWRVSTTSASNQAPAPLPHLRRYVTRERKARTIKATASYGLQGLLESVVETTHIVVNHSLYLNERHKDIPILLIQRKRGEKSHVQNRFNLEGVPISLI